MDEQNTPPAGEGAVDAGASSVATPSEASEAGQDNAQGAGEEAGAQVGA